jgi:hypothetical protein
MKGGIMTGQFPIYTLVSLKSDDVVIHSGWTYLDDAIDALRTEAVALAKTLNEEDFLKAVSDLDVVVMGVNLFQIEPKLIEEADEETQQAKRYIINPSYDGGF